MTDRRPDPVPGSPDFYRLPFEERLRICEERIGIFREPVDDGAFVLPGRPYGASDPIRSPFDSWKDVP
jgi:hypothetical protein